MFLQIYYAFFAGNFQLGIFYVASGKLYDLWHCKSVFPASASSFWSCVCLLYFLPIAISAKFCFIAYALAAALLLEEEEKKRSKDTGSNLLLQTESSNANSGPCIMISVHMRWNSLNIHDVSEKVSSSPHLHKVVNIYTIALWFPGQSPASS